MARPAGHRAKKKAIEEERTIVFVDQSGFYLLPMAVHTYAPVGQTPILKVPLTRDHLSAIGSLTIDGRLIMHIQEQSFKGPDVVRFLQLLLRKLPGKLLVIWDGAPIHRCQVVKDFLVAGGAKRLHLERLPGYAPELNPKARGVEFAQAARTQEPLCSRFRATCHRAGAGQGTAQASQNGPAPMYRSCWLSSLDIYSEINNVRAFMWRAGPSRVCAR